METSLVNIIAETADTVEMLTITAGNANLSYWGNRYGGGMFNYPYGQPTLTNCIFSGSSATESGGGIFNDMGQLKVVTLVNCTFAGNSAPRGNALACDSYNQWYPSSIQVTNCILRDGGNEIWNNNGSTITINYSDVQGGQGFVYDPCDSEPDQVVVTVVPPMESQLWVFPQVIYRHSRMPKILAWMRLPEGVTKDHVDSDQQLILYPAGSEAIRQYIFPAPKSQRLLQKTICQSGFRCGVCSPSYFSILVQIYCFCFIRATQSLLVSCGG